MGNKTESEMLFEQFCIERGIRYEPISTESDEGQKTPDYYIYPNAQLIVVEVKQIDPTKQELEQLKEFETKGWVVSGEGKPGDRVRNKIAAGGKQIRVKAGDKYPTLLVLYNNVSLFNHANAYSIKVAMYGLETHLLAIPQDPSQRPYLVEKKYGPKRKMTIDANTSISAVGVLAKDNDLGLQLSIFHNIYAAIPIPPQILRYLGVMQFTLEQKQVSQFSDWIEI